MFGLFVHLKQ